MSDKPMNSEKGLPQDYLQYDKRRHGMDHEFYPWSMLHQRKSIHWPQGKKLAVWLNISVQFFPMDQKGKPFKVPGGMTMPYPDLRHYSLRDYGNRVGIFRILKAVDHYGVKPTFAISSRLVEQAPLLIHKLAQRGDEILCHGWDMDSIHWGDAAQAEANNEAGLIEKSLAVLRQATGQPITGWLSPAQNQSEITAKLLANNGVKYCGDWVNDDMPYFFNNAGANPQHQGALLNIPLSTELDDQFILQNNLHSEASYVQQVCDACDLLLNEAEHHGGRMLALNIHPWLLGQPHRIAHFEQLLAYLTSKSDIWFATGSEIHSAFSQQSA